MESFEEIVLLPVGLDLREEPSGVFGEGGRHRSSRQSVMIGRGVTAGFAERARRMSSRLSNWRRLRMSARPSSMALAKLLAEVRKVASSMTRSPEVTYSMISM